MNIIFEDEYLVVIDKPAGLVVNRAESVKESTLQDWMEERFKIQDFRFKNKEDEELFGRRMGLVHRLDKDTSGVMVVAKTPSALEELMRQFKEREVEKEYVALVHGNLEPKRGVMRLPLARSRGDRKKFTVDPFGKMAETAYGVSANYQLEEKDYSLVSLFPKTGRTHQLRVHLKHLGHPIVGDAKYVGKKRAKLDSEWCKRQFLHAKKLAFSHPESGERVSFEAELSEDLKESLKRLKKID